MCLQLLQIRHQQVDINLRHSWQVLALEGFRLHPDWQCDSWLRAWANGNNKHKQSANGQRRVARSTAHLFSIIPSTTVNPRDVSKSVTQKWLGVQLKNHNTCTRSALRAHARSLTSLHRLSVPLSAVSTANTFIFRLDQSDKQISNKMWPVCGKIERKWIHWSVLHSLHRLNPCFLDVKKPRPLRSHGCYCKYLWTSFRRSGFPRCRFGRLHAFLCEERKKKTCTHAHIYKTVSRIAFQRYTNVPVTYPISFR